MKQVFLILLLLAPILGATQDKKDIRITGSPDEKMVRKIFDEALLNGHSYGMLDYLSNSIGGRLSGSPEAAMAVEWAHQAMDTLGFDTVYRQPVMVPRWVRGGKEKGRILGSKTHGTIEVPICALGGSVATPKGGLSAELIEVHSFDELESLGREKVEGKIVFYNRPMDARHIYTFHAYGGCVEQRWAGAKEAVDYGAVGVLVRSMNLKLDDDPHTGSMAYDEGEEKIPAAAISTNGAELLSRLMKEQPDIRFHFEMSCYTLPDVLSYNVIGEIKGTEHPDEIILVGGHLDSWDIGDGSHDDGAGCVQAIEALRIFKDLNIKPKRTLRAVMFMNEENGLRGAQKYAELAEANEDNHIVAIESDRGGFSPRGFHMEANPEQIQKVSAWRSILEPYGLHDFKAGGSGADVSPLRGNNTLLVGLVPDSQRYFDHHHAASDVFENVNRRELELGAAAMTALMYLFSEYGN